MDLPVDFVKEINSYASPRLEGLIDAIKSTTPSVSIRVNKYKEVLAKAEVANNVDLIYIDPPYTNAHYSRFYHILETLVDYDYPIALLAIVKTNRQQIAERPPRSVRDRTHDIAQ